MWDREARQRAANRLLPARWETMGGPELDREDAGNHGPRAFRRIAKEKVPVGDMRGEGGIFRF